MPYVNTVETESIQAGKVANIPLSTVEIWPSLDPQLPFSLQNMAVANMIGMTNQIGIYNGFGVWDQMGVYNGIGQGTDVGGHVDGQPYLDSCAPSMDLSTANGNLWGLWKYNGATICAPCPSDARLKKNISKIDNAVEKVLSLNGVTFSWDEKVAPSLAEKSKGEIGLIAQEVEKNFPELIENINIKDSIEEVKSIKYQNIVALLIEAVREQQDQIEDLKRTVKELSTGCSKCQGVCYDV